MRIDARDILRSPLANARCSSLNIAVNSGSVAPVGGEFGHALFVEGGDALLRFSHLGESFSGERHLADRWNCRGRH